MLASHSLRKCSLRSGRVSATIPRIPCTGVNLRAAPWQSRIHRRHALPVRCFCSSNREEPMATMRAVQVTEANGALELVEREVPSPGPGEVLVKVEACGVCHSDA